MTAKLSNETFIKRARERHGSRYDYSKVDYKNSKTKVTIICSVHGEFQQAPFHHINGRGCSECGKKQAPLSKRKDSAYFIQKAKEVHGNKYDYSRVVYTTTHKKVTIICPVHGAFEQKGNSHLSGQGCRKCSIEKNKLSLSQDTDYFISKARKVHDNKYDYSQVSYERSYKKVTIICPIHGEFQQVPNSHLRGRGCPECGKIIKNQKKSYDSADFIKKANDVHGEKYNYSLVEYENSIKKVIINCVFHGEFQQLPSSHLSGKGCPTCASKKRGLLKQEDKDSFISKAIYVHGDRYDYSKVNYKKSKSKVTIICPEHQEFEQNPNSHLMGHGCPKCVLRGSSNIEDCLVDYIKTFYTKTIITGDRTYIKPKELDIVLPDINLAVEFNGLYWHSEALKEDKRYHLNKTKACRSAGLRLIHVFESEWVTTPEIVKSRLKQIIGAQTNRIYARQCSVRELSSTEAKDFFNRTHIQGHVGNRIALGLIHNDKIVSAMSFGKPRYNKDYDFELLRFSNELNTSVVGGASKLFKNFQRLYNSPSVISYADLRWSDGNLYEVLGFDFVRQSSPNYYYFKGTSLELESRIKYQKHKLPKILDEFDESLSETENMALNGYNRIFDCGNAVYAYNP